MSCCLWSCVCDNKLGLKFWLCKLKCNKSHLDFIQTQGIWCQHYIHYIFTWPLDFVFSFTQIKTFPPWIDAQNTNWCIKMTRMQQTDVFDTQNFLVQDSICPDVQILPHFYFLYHLIFIFSMIALGFTLLAWQQFEDMSPGSGRYMNIIHFDRLKD